MAIKIHVFFISALLACTKSYLALPQYDLSMRAYGGHGEPSSTASSTIPPTSGFPTSNKGCFPNIIKTVPADLRNKAGIFYEYRSKSNNEQVYNALFNNTIVSDPVYLPGTTTLAIHVAERYQHVTLSSSGQRICDNQEFDFLSRLDGTTFIQYFDSLNGANNPLYLVLSYLYDDSRPNGFEIVLICFKLNFASGMCDEPNVFVNVRVHPNQMSAADKSAIDDIVDKTLKPFCMSKADLQVTIFRTDLAPCTDPPRQDFLNLLAGYNASLARPA